MLPERYQIVDELTARRDVRAWRAVDTETDEDVFVKELVLEYVESWKAVELFEREIKTLRQLDHPMVPEFVDSWTYSEESVATFGIARRWVEGTPLSEVLRVENENLAEERSHELLSSVAQLLEYLHAFRPPVVHRDITPSHLVERADGSFMVVGFGGVQAALPKTRGGSTFVGTSGYIPPEQLMGSASPASDVYALGVTVVALLSGLKASDLPVVEMRLRFHEHVEVSAPLVALLDSMTSPVAEKRPPDGAALMRRLERLDTEMTRIEETILDHPPPPSLRVQSRDERLIIKVGERFRRGGGLRTFAGFVPLIAIATTAVFAAASIQFGYEVLSGAVFSTIFFTVVGGFGVFVAAALTLLPKKLVLDTDRGWTRWRTRALGWDWSDVNDVQKVDEGGNISVAIEIDDELITVLQSLDHDEADWVRERIRGRLRHD